MLQSIWRQEIKLIAPGCPFCDSLKESSQLQSSGHGILVDACLQFLWLPGSTQWLLTTWSISIFLETFSISFSVSLPEGLWPLDRGVRSVHSGDFVDWRHQRWQCSRNSCVQEKLEFLAFNETESLQKHTRAVIKAFFLPPHTCSSLFIRDNLCRCAGPQKHTPMDKDGRI